MEAFTNIYTSTPLINCLGIYKGDDKYGFVEKDHHKVKYHRTHKSSWGNSIQLFLQIYTPTLNLLRANFQVDVAWR